MTNFYHLPKFVLILSTILFASNANAQRIQQKLGRGVVAVYGNSNGSAGVEITWRRLAQEPENARYNIYVSREKDGAYTLLNNSPVSNTNYATTLSRVPYNSWVAVSILTDDGESEKSKPFHFKNNGLRNIYMEISFNKSPLKASNYSTKFVWPCDLNGDGEYDYVVDRNPVDGTENHFVEAYLADGTYLWTIDLGVNELSSSGQDDQICAYDIDCDGYGEVLVQTSDGTRFWDKDKNDWGLYVNRSTSPDTDGDGIVNYNNEATRNAPKYMTVVNGMTGEEKASIEQNYDNAYNRTNRATLMGDEYYRHTGHVGIAYLDGIHPALIMEWHTRTKEGAHQYRNSAFAYDFNGKEAHNWHQVFMKPTGGQTFHQIRIFDADGDGCDEMSSGAYCMNNDGNTLYNTGIAHGDRHRTADIDPERPGLETFSIQQDAGDMLGQILFDAGTGEHIKKWYLPAVGDVGRGECLDLDPSHLGWEMFSTMDSYQLYDAKGNKIEGKYGFFPTEGIWWDGELDRERVDTPDGNGYNAMIVDWTKGRYIEMAKESGWTIQTTNGKRGKFWGDIIGDWREELVLSRIVDGVNTGIVGFTTDFATNINNIYCLQEDPHYRGDCTTKGYYQSPDPAFYLGYDMPRPQLPPCMVADDKNDVFGIAEGNSDITPHDGVKNIYAMPVKNQTMTLSQLNGDATLWKSQLGKLIIEGNNFSTGNTIISEGILELNGTSTSTIDLRARGTLTGSGTVHGIVFEGAINYEGGRIMPSSIITFADGLKIDKKTFVEIDLKSNAHLLVKGNLNVSSNVIFTINADDIKPGEYELITYSDAFSGSISNFSVRGLIGIAYTIDNIPNENGEGGKITLTVKGQRDASDNVIWTGTTNGKWDYQNDNFTLFGSPTSFVAGDGIIFDDSSSRVSVTLSELLPASSVTFKNDTKNYTIQGDGGISGNADVIFDGKGKVTLNTTNSDYKGKTIINSGTVTVKELADAGIPSSFGAAGSATSNLQVGKATIIINNTNTSTNRGIMLNDSATINIQSGTTSLKGIIIGNGTLIKTGAGQLNITYGGANGWSNTVLTSGTLAMGSWNTTFGKATSPIHVNGNATITVFDNNSTSAVPTLQNEISIDTLKTLTFHAGQRCAIKGKLLGKGTYKINFPYVRGDVYTDVSKFEGIYQVTTSNCRFIQAMDFSKATLKLDANSYAAGFKAGSGTEMNYTHKIGTLTGSGTLGTGTWQIKRFIINYKISSNAVTCDAVTINGTVSLTNPVFDLRTSSLLSIPNDADFIVIPGTGKRNISGDITILPEKPKEGYVWDTSRLSSDGIISITPEATDIETVSLEGIKGCTIRDLNGRIVTNPVKGIFIVNGKKVLIN